MTQARTHTPGLGNPPLIQLWLEAVLCAFVRLVQGVRATLGMRFNLGHRDWHTKTEREALPQAKPDIHIKDPTTPTASFSASCREFLLDLTRELADDPRETLNREPRHKAEDDTGDVAASDNAGRAELASPSLLIPTKVGIQDGPQGLSRLAAAVPRQHHNRSRMPTVVGMSGTS